MQEALKSIDQLKSSIQEVDQMLRKAQERSSSLIKASNKFFFDIFQQILPEIQQELTAELQKNEKILQDQKDRSEAQLHFLENEFQNAQTLIQSNNIQGILSSQTQLLSLLSSISSSYSVPRCTDNINLFCSDYIFNNPDEEFDPVDQYIVVSSIVKIFSQLFQICFSIPSLVNLEKILSDKSNIHQNHEKRKNYELQKKAIRDKEDNEIQKRLMQIQKQKTFDFGNIHWSINSTSLQSLYYFQHQIEQWIGEKQWKLLYKATRDGFKPLDFHSKCDNQGSTVTIITSKEGYVFGGYTPISWSSSINNYVQDISNQSFIFTLINPHKIPPTQYLLIQPLYAIYSHSRYGPCFGSNCDIYMHDQFDQCSSTYTKFPQSYSDTTGKGSSTFTGAENFFVQEIEVFNVSN